LNGLEISEVSFDYLKKSNEIFRIDSTFYLKEFLSYENLILKNKHTKLSLITDDIKSFGAYSLNNMVEYQKNGIPFIRGINMKNGMVNFNDMLYITKEANELLHKSEVKPEMILVSMSGTIGDVAISTRRLELSNKFKPRYCKN
jgi:type I restriction enzyme M protein